MATILTDEQLAAVIDNINNKGASLASQARELGVSDQTLRNWIKKAESKSYDEEEMEQQIESQIEQPQLVAKKENPNEKVNPLRLFHIVRKANNEPVAKPKGRNKSAEMAA